MARSGLFSPPGCTAPRSLLGLNAPQDLRNGDRSASAAAVWRVVSAAGKAAAGPSAVSLLPTEMATAEADGGI